MSQPDALFEPAGEAWLRTGAWVCLDAVRGPLGPSVQSLLFDELR